MSTTTQVVKTLVTAALTVSFALFPSPLSAGEQKMEQPVLVETVVFPPTPTPKPKKHIVHASSGDCQAYYSIISKYDWPVDTAMQICRDESHGVTTTINENDHHYDAHHKLICVGSDGLFQVGCFWPKSLGYTRDDLMDPEKNVAMAYAIWRELGFNPWSTYKG